MKYRTTLISTVATAVTLATVAAPLFASAQIMRPIVRTRAEASSTIRTRGGVRISSTTLRARVEARARVSATTSRSAHPILRTRRSASTTPSQGTPARNTASRTGARSVARHGSVMQVRIDREISRRIDLLRAFETRISNMHMSDTGKSHIQATIQSQISTLASLQTQVASSSSTTTIRNTLKSVVQSYRVFALVMPQAAITAAADRVDNIVSQMQDFSSKLSARISAGGSSTASLSATLSDFNAKVTDAKTQAGAAVSEINALTPSNGDQKAFQANRSALKDAHKKLQTAQQDLVAARKDAGTIVHGLGGSVPTTTASGSASASASTTASTTVQ